MNPIDQAWAIIKQSDDYGDVATSLEDYHGEPQETNCELCSKRITLDEVGGFTDSGPHCKKCDNNLCEHCNGEGYHDYDESDSPLPRHVEAEAQMCEECQGSGLASGPPKKDDYMPSDGEGYEGALNEWKNKYGNQ